MIVSECALLGHSQVATKIEQICLGLGILFIWIIRNNIRLILSGMWYMFEYSSLHIVSSSHIFSFEDGQKAVPS